MLLTPVASLECYGGQLLAKSLLLITATCSILLLDLPIYTRPGSDNSGTEESGVMVRSEIADEEFSCGGGPFSYFMASLVSIPCDRHQSMQAHPYN